MKAKIKPKLPRNKNFTRINELKKGDIFICDGELHILIDEDPQSIDLATGSFGNWDNGTEVIPVSCEITWKRIPYKKDKK